jgi:hypothetical protein
MADYQLTDPMSGGTIIRTEDNTYIPPDPANRDYAEYLRWVDEGGVPDPYVEPEPVPDVPTAGEELAFDHENRIRALEGQPPISVGDFINQMKSSP